MIDLAAMYSIQQHDCVLSFNEMRLAAAVSVNRNVTVVSLRAAALPQFSDSDRLCACIECRGIRTILTEWFTLYHFGNRELPLVQSILYSGMSTSDSWLRWLAHPLGLASLDATELLTRLSFPVTQPVGTYNNTLMFTSAPLAEVVTPSAEENEDETSPVEPRCNDCEETLPSGYESPCGVTHCTDCCECWHCECCERWYTSSSSRTQCSTCNSCSRCCNCLRCSGCSEMVSPEQLGCGNCDRCENCNCVCDDDEPSNADFLREGMLRFWQATPTEYKTNKSRRFISLEIEVQSASSSEAYTVQQAARAWGDPIVQDGSLGDEGFEINTNPSSGDKFVKHIESIMRALRSAEATVDDTCGMHCHVGAQDFKYLDLYKLCKLYCKVENAMFRLVDLDRRGGSYSRVSQIVYNFDDVKFPDFRAELTRRLYSIDPTELDKRPNVNWTSGMNRRKLADKSEKYLQIRYYALNLHSFFLRGTIEFRHHHGCLDAGRAIMWGRVCAAVVDAASSMSVKQIDALPTKTKDALLAILPEDVQKWASANMREPRPRDQSKADSRGEIL